MAWGAKDPELELRVRSTSPVSPKQEDVAIEELGHKATIPRTLTSRLGIVGTISTVVCPWPSALSIAPLALSNGGTGGLLIGFIVSAFFMTLVYYLIAEKMPLTPTAGGQYHMVLKLAPQKYRRFLSYICGFALCFTWESYLTSASWLFGMNISGIITIWTGGYQTYYTFVPAVCMLIFACAVNLSWGRHMNVFESLVLVVQFAAFFLVVVVLGMASGTQTLSASFTFDSFTGYPRWIGVLLGFSYCTGVLGGFDCATHLAEDTEDPRNEIPKALLLSTTVNSFSCIVVAILVTFCAGDLTLRMLFSLIRDGRDPIVTKLFARDLNGQGLPRRCVVIACILPLIILWINFVSLVGFQAIISQVTLALVITYFMVFACSLNARINRPGLLGSTPNGFFKPGRSLGIAMDIMAMVFLFVMGLVCCIPFAPNPNAAGWNYAPFMILAVVLIGLVVWFASARKHYRPGQGVPGHV
ncbi:hypothetical protein LTR56_021546 [Elasticomyces elasticus]|nr:hypothetical protein LTR56_021546 [Elasticomyces elasticus]KAK3631284.1 hypothetical protein LTR22_021168 [Elasticomyces elasticus]KAK4909334.1 hypothetical protein LTR49_021846 [Elasticomyces elasticus]KAK5749362.1 hypothetical protein LTS12_020543 [Elasticomyces elasticus]